MTMTLCVKPEHAVQNARCARTKAPRRVRKDARAYAKCARGMAIQAKTKSVCSVQSARKPKPSVRPTVADEMIHDAARRLTLS